MAERAADEAAPGADAADERRAWQRALLDESPLAIAMAEGGLTTYGNAGYLKLFGYQRLEELLGRPLVEQIAPESRAAVLDRIERRKRGEAVPPSIEVIALRKDGGRFVDLITSKILQLPTGTSVFAFHEDITARRQAEEALRAREARLLTLAASLPIFLMELSTDGTIQFINRVLPHLTVEQVLGRSWLDWVPPESHPRARVAIAQVLETGQTRSFETPGEGPGGKPSWYLTRLSPMLREGVLAGVTLITDDITERREAQVALQASEARYRALIEQAPVPIGIHRRGVPTYANPAFLRLHGLRSIDDLGPLGLLALVAPESWALVLEQVRLRAAGLPNEQEYEYLGLRLDGTTFPCAIHVVPVELEDGPASLAFHQDLTSVRRATEALRASEERFRALLEQSAEGVLVLDEEGVITEWNLAMARITGVPGEAARGRSGWDLMLELAVPGDGGPERLELLRRATQVGPQGEEPAHAQRAEVSIRRLDGEVRRVQQTAFTLRLGGKPALGVLSQDITERKQAEEAREQAERQLHQTQKMEALGTLSGGIAHDFNNLLSVVLVDSEALCERLPEGDERRELAEEIFSSGLRARELVRRILTFARRQEPARRPERLEAVAAEALELLHASLAPNVAIQLDAAPGTPTALIDANQLHQVVTNLATNAAHAMGDAGGVLRVELSAAHLTPEECAGRPELRPGHFARLTVRDSGSGMTPATLKRIFEPFFTTKPLGQGTGLGLSIVHGIVARHDGFISVESSPGVGSAFHLHFPAYEGPAASVAQLESPMPAVPSELRVLLVDDEELVLRASGRMLSKKGLSVTSFSSPKAALAAFTADPAAFDAALLDLAMPEMSGLELATLLTSVRPGFPVLLASGNASAVGPEQARAAGIKEIVGKPYDAKTLLDAVERATRGG